MDQKDHTEIRSDIQNLGWIDKLPEQYRTYAILARADRPIGTWLLLLPGLWGIVYASGWPLTSHIWVYVLIGIFALGAFLMRSAGCVVNDILDRNLDKSVQRTASRPLASGALSVPQALGFLAVLLFISFCLLLTLSGTAIWLGLLVVPLIAAYPLMKRFTYWPQAFLGITFNFSALMGYAAVADSLSTEVYVLYVSAIFWTLGYDTIYAHQDAEDDALVGIKSTALKFGTYSKICVSGFYGLSFVLIVYVFSTISLYATLFALPAGIHLLWQLNNWNLEDTQNCLKIFKSNRDYGLLILAGFVSANILDTVL